MKIRLIIGTILFLSSIAGASGADIDIRLNSLGFLPGMSKKATISADCSSFSVKKASNGETVYSGRVTGPFRQQDLDQEVWIAEFSQVSAKG